MQLWSLHDKKLTFWQFLSFISFYPLSLDLSLFSLTFPFAKVTPKKVFSHCTCVTFQQETKMKMENTIIFMAVKRNFGREASPLFIRPSHPLEVSFQFSFNPFIASHQLSHRCQRASYSWGLFMLSHPRCPSNSSQRSYDGI